MAEISEDISQFQKIWEDIKLNKTSEVSEILDRYSEDFEIENPIKTIEHLLNFSDYLFGLGFSGMLSSEEKGYLRGFGDVIKDYVVEQWKKNPSKEITQQINRRYVNADEPELMAQSVLCDSSDENLNVIGEILYKYTHRKSQNIEVMGRYFLENISKEDDLEVWKEKFRKNKYFKTFGDTLNEEICKRFHPEEFSILQELDFEYKPDVVWQKYREYLKLDEPLEALDMLANIKKYSLSKDYSVRDKIDDKIFVLAADNPTSEMLDKIKQLFGDDDARYWVIAFNITQSEELLQKCFEKIHQNLQKAIFDSVKRDKCVQIFANFEYHPMLFKHVMNESDEDIQLLLCALSSVKELPKEVIGDIYNVVSDLEDIDSDVRKEIERNLILQKNYDKKAFSEILDSYVANEADISSLDTVVGLYPTVDGAVALLKASSRLYDDEEQECFLDEAVDAFIKTSPNVDDVKKFIDNVRGSVYTFEYGEIAKNILKFNKSPDVVNAVLDGAENFDLYAVYADVLDENNALLCKSKILNHIKKCKPDDLYDTDRSQISICLKKLLDYDSSTVNINRIKKLAESKGIDIGDHKLIIQPKMLTLLERANEIVQAKDKKALKKFKHDLTEMGDKEIFRVDHAAMEFLVDNFTEENLKKVNNLRSFWGLRAIISEDSLTEKNLRDIRRMEFSSSVSETSSENEHYSHTYSEVYKNFVPDYSVQYEAKQYKKCLKESAAVALLNEHGFSSFTKQLPEVLSA